MNPHNNRAIMLSSDPIVDSSETANENRRLHQPPPSLDNKVESATRTLKRFSRAMNGRIGSTTRMNTDDHPPGIKAWQELATWRENFAAELKRVRELRENRNEADAEVAKLEAQCLDIVALRAKFNELVGEAPALSEPVTNAMAELALARLRSLDTLRISPENRVLLHNKEVEMHKRDNPSMAFDVLRDRLN